jgi:nucleoside-diphosphate-sugar epimerase
VKLLVTGGAGFIGSHLVRTLLLRGDSVRVLDSFETGRRENLADIPGELEIQDGDVREIQLCRDACQGMEAVFHLAAIGSVPLSIDNPLETHEVNVTGTLNVLVAARERGVRRVVFASSSSVYGDGPEKAKTEALRPLPASPYAVSKLAAEAYAVAFHRVYGLETVALRYFNIFGPRQDPHSQYAAVVPRFITSLLEGKAPPIYGDGQQTRDFTYVENVVRANLLALECPPEACGRAYNVGCGEATSVNELFRAIRERIGGEAVMIKPVHEPAKTGDVRDSMASIELAREALGYVPTVGVEEGIRHTVDWYRGRGGA